MKSSTSLGLKGVIFDANVLSLLAKEGHLDLLPQFFALPRYILRALLIALQKAGLLTASEVKKILAEE